VIWSLMKKPGAFTRYRWREELFPSLIFRRTYDVLRSFQLTELTQSMCAFFISLQSAARRWSNVSWPNSWITPAD
jgi:hypothetical protein